MSTCIITRPASKLRSLDRFELAGVEYTIQYIVKYEDSPEAVEITFCDNETLVSRKLQVWDDDLFVINFDPMHPAYLKS